MLRTAIPRATDIFAIQLHLKGCQCYLSGPHYKTGQSFSLDVHLALSDVFQYFFLHKD